MPFEMLLGHAVLCYPGLDPLILKSSALIFQSFSDDWQLHFSFLVVFPLFLVYPAGLLKKALRLLSEPPTLVLGLRLSALPPFLFQPYIVTYLHILLIKVGVTNESQYCICALLPNSLSVMDMVCPQF